jgi:uncharacterized protein YqgC (DUF456 family)
MIFFAVVIHKFFLPQFVSIWTLVALGFLAGFALLLDTVCSIGGAKYYGATSWGLFGSAAGGLIGLWFGPLGLLAGAIFGAAAAEIVFSKKPLEEAMRAGFGAGLGLLASTAGRAAICLLMIAAFVADCLI